MTSQSKAKKTETWREAYVCTVPDGRYCVRTVWSCMIITLRKDKNAAIRYAKKLGYAVEPFKGEKLEAW